jgi:hypothetical protein
MVECGKVEGGGDKEERKEKENKEQQKSKTKEQRGWRGGNSPDSCS